MHIALLVWQLIVLAIDVWILVYMFKPHVKQAFGASAT
jgi:F0F1-type ATP synthase membrane subunit b/b'